MDAAQFLPTEHSPEVTQIHEGDYKDADGLWHCGVCGKARQKKINSPYFNKTVWCICDCRVKELEEQRRKEEYEEEMKENGQMNRLLLERIRLQPVLEVLGLKTS